MVGGGGVSAAADLNGLPLVLLFGLLCHSSLALFSMLFPCYFHATFSIIFHVISMLRSVLFSTIFHASPSF